MEVSKEGGSVSPHRGVYSSHPSYHAADPMLIQSTKYAKYTNISSD